MGPGFKADGVNEPGIYRILAEKSGLGKAEGFSFWSFMPPHDPDEGG